MVVPYEAPVAIDATHLLVMRTDDGRHLRIPVNDRLAERLAFLRIPLAVGLERAA